MVVACGLLFEARIAARSGNVIAHAGGADEQRLHHLLSRSARDGARAILSFGVAGALDPAFKAGDLVCASDVLAKGERFQTHPQWTARIEAALPHVTRARVLGSDLPIVTAPDKAHAFRATGCAIVDMESGVAARVAQDFNLPFAVLRAISDEADCDVPSAALAGMAADGRTDVVAVLRALGKDPQQIRALLKLAWSAKAARESLLRCVGLLSPGIGGIDLG